jgi:hypothetical protein
MVSKKFRLRAEAIVPTMKSLFSICSRNPRPICKLTKSFPTSSADPRVFHPYLCIISLKNERYTNELMRL